MQGLWQYDGIEIMKNTKPEFTDRQLKLIEDSISCLRGDYILDKGYSPDELNEVFWLCKFYRIRFRRCQVCNCHRKVEDMVSEVTCNKCKWGFKI